VRKPVIEARPDRRGRRDVVRVVQAPVGPRENLLRDVRVNDDRIDWDVRQIPALVLPGKRRAIRGAGYPKDMAGGGRGVGVKASHRSVPNRNIGCGHGRIERDAEHRPIGQDGVGAGNVHPVRLPCRPRAKIESDPDIRVIRPDNRHAVILRRIFDLIDKGAVTQRSLRHVLS
jgi:hypothetical protein